MSLRLITPPAVEPVTPAEIRTRLGLTETNAPDAMLTPLITAAREELDGPYGLLDRALNAQTWDLYLDEFPINVVEIPLPPLISITSVNYMDVDAIEQTIPITDYEVDTYSDPGWIIPVGSWPTILDTINAVRIRFVAGYGALGSDVPEPIRQWITLKVGTAGAMSSSSFMSSSGSGAGGPLRSVTVEGVGTRTYATSSSTSWMSNASYTDVLKSTDSILTRYNRRIAYV